MSPASHCKAQPKGGRGQTRWGELAGSHRVGPKWLCSKCNGRCARTGSSSLDSVRLVQSAPSQTPLQVPQVCPQGLRGEAWAPATPPTWWPPTWCHLWPAAGPSPLDQGGCVAGVARDQPLSPQTVLLV